MTKEEYFENRKLLDDAAKLATAAVLAAKKELDRVNIEIHKENQKYAKANSPLQKGDRVIMSSRVFLGFGDYKDEEHTVEISSIIMHSGLLEANRDPFRYKAKKVGVRGNTLSTNWNSGIPFSYEEIVRKAWQ